MLNYSDLKSKLISTGYFIDNDYLDKYLNLIIKNKDTLKAFGYETHHILQRKYFKIINADVDETESNKVNLLYKDHILAHYYLSLCTTNDLKISNIQCFLMMTFYKNKLTDDEKDIYRSLDEYQTLYEKWIMWLSENGPKRYSDDWSEYSRNLISKMFKGKPKSDEHKKHLKEARDSHSTTKGKKSIYNIKLNKVKFVFPDEIDKYLITGDWIIGGKPLSAEQKNKISNSNSKSLKGKKSKGLNKGLTPWKVKCIDTGEIFDSIKDASNWMANNGYGSGGHIRECCDGSRESTFNLHWEWVDKNK